MRFAVITEVCDPETGGNAATALGQLYRRTSGTGLELEPVDGMTAMMLSIPVFHVGEILILNEGGREISGLGRKPSKWDIEYEVFDMIEGAVQRALEVAVHGD